MKICAFTGHRPKGRLPGIRRKEAVSADYAGMCHSLCAAGVRWPEALRNRYFSIAERCDKETMLQRQYTPDCL